MSLSIRELASDSNHEHCLMFLYDSILPLLRRKVRIHLQQLFRMNEENILREHRLDLRELDVQFVFGNLYGFVYPADCLFKKCERPIFRRYDLLPVPLVHIDGMDVVQFLFRTKSIHIGIYSSSGRNAHLCKFHPLPFCKRMHNFRFASVHILDRERHRTLHSVKVVIQTCTAQDNHRCSNPEQGKLRGKVVLEHVLDCLDRLLCILEVSQNISVSFRNHKCHIHIF